ncbi:MAG: hypothetical protein R3E48_13350 [Burkholderiaceae bacterium]
MVARIACAQADAAIGAAIADQRRDARGVAVGCIGGRVDDDQAGAREGRAQLGGRAIVATAQVDGRRGCHAGDLQGRDAIEGDAEALVVGGAGDDDRCRAKKYLALAEAGRVDTRGVLEELDPVGAGRQVDREVDVEVGTVLQYPREHGEVEQRIATGVRVVDVVVAHAVAAEVDRLTAVGVDRIAQDRVVSGCPGKQQDTVAAATRDPVAFASTGATDPNARARAAQIDTGPAVADERGAVRAQPDVVAGGDMATRAVAEVEPGLTVGGDDVSIRDRAAADAGVVGELEAHAHRGVAAVQQAGDVGADMVAGNQMAVGGLHADAAAAESVDDQAANSAAVATAAQFDSVDRRPGEAAVDLDDRRAGEVGLGRAVDDDEVGDDRQCRGRLDRVRAADQRLRDVEVDLVGPRGIVGRLDRLPERDAAVRASVGHQRLQRGGVAVHRVGSGRDPDVGIGLDEYRLAVRPAAGIAVRDRELDGPPEYRRVLADGLERDASSHCLRDRSGGVGIEADIERRRAVGPAHEAADQHAAIADIGTRDPHLPGAVALVDDGQAVGRGAVGGDRGDQVSAVEVGRIRIGYPQYGLHEYGCASFREDRRRAGDGDLGRIIGCRDRDRGRHGGARVAAVAGNEIDHARSRVRRVGGVFVGDRAQHLLVVRQRVDAGEGEYPGPHEARRDAGAGDVGGQHFVGAIEQVGDRDGERREIYRVGVCDGGVEVRD